MPFAGYDDFDDCVSSNSDKNDPEAYCATIKREVEGESALSDTEAQAAERVALQGPVVTLAELQQPGAIERDEEDDGTVRYGSVLLLAPGVWGDAGSGRQILYSEEGIANSADNWDDNTVNLFHERENEVTEVGEVDTSSIFLGEDDGGLYGDIVLTMDNPASEFADEALQNALETNGREGIQGPSVELRGEDYRFNADEGVHELVEGTFNGLGLVGLGVSPGPGSEDAAFAEQTKERAVALASDGGADVFTPTHDNDVTMELHELRERLESEDVPLSDDADEDDLRKLAAALDIELQDDDEEDGDDMDDDGDSDDEANGGDEDGGEDDEDDVDINLEDVAGRVESMSEQVQQNAERIDAMAERFEDLDDGANLSELFKTVSNVSEQLETLAEAETVEELDNRLSELEDQTEAPTSLAADAEPGDDQGDDDPESTVEWGTNAPHNPRVTGSKF